MQVRRKGIHHADRRGVLLIGLAAAVIAVAEEVVVHVHLHGAVAQACLQGPVAQQPVGLYEGVEAGGSVDFIATQCAFDTVHTVEGVGIALAIILAAVVIKAGDQRQVAGGAGDGLQPVDRAPVEFAVESHYAAASVCRVECATGEFVRNRQVLNHAAPSCVRIDLQRRIADVALVIHA